MFSNITAITPRIGPASPTCWTIATQFYLKNPIMVVDVCRIYRKHIKLGKIFELIRKTLK
jgi:hypothetical protein